jgi:hypothetical protein
MFPDDECRTGRMLYGNHGTEISAQGHITERPAIARLAPSSDALKLPALVTAAERAARSDRVMLEALRREVRAAKIDHPYAQRPIANALGGRVAAC